MWENERRLDDYLRGRLKDALTGLAAIGPDDLLSENVEVVVAALHGKFMPTEVAVDWSDPTRSAISEVTTRVRDPFDRDKIHEVPASKMVISFPISGSTEMLGYRASTSSMGGPSSTVSGGAVVIEIVERNLDANVIRAEIERVTKDLDTRAGWANADLANFAPTAEREIRNAYAIRKDRILNDRAVGAALDIPVRKAEGPRPPIVARRKHVSLQTRRAQSTFVPEPVLADAVFHDVLDVVRSWAASLERTPMTTAKLDEEELRDLLLGTLNGYWRGAAGGELFNGRGKTDILIREGDRNAFIAECKIWRGPQGVADALNQLLSYLVWRDSKAALVMFIKTADPSATITKLHASVQGHSSHVLTKLPSNPSGHCEYIVTADAEGRRVSLAVVPVVVHTGGA